MFKAVGAGVAVAFEKAGVNSITQSSAMAEENIFSKQLAEAKKAPEQKKGQEENNNPSRKKKR
eukprot:7582601-Prorocentrum_lima.AAC.1